MLVDNSNHDEWYASDEELSMNSFCDNAGFCCGVSCRNYWSCRGSEGGDNDDE